MVAIIIVLSLLVVMMVGSWVLLTRPILSRGGAAENLGIKVDPVRLRRHVDQLSVVLMPRSYENLENLSRVADYIASEFTAAGAAVRLQPFKAQGNEYRNVIAEFGPESEAVIVVGAHYDSAGALPAADDNASGIAGLIELARLVAVLTPGYRIMLVAFCLEEPPFFNTVQMGSAVFARSLVDAGKKVRIMIALEMIGYFSDAPGSQAYPIPLLKLFYPTKGNFIAVVDQLFSGRAREMKKIMRANSRIPVHSINAPAAIPGIDLSDHKSFWDQGYPAVMITDTAFFRNTAYHTAADTADRLDYARMAQVVRGVFAYVRKIGTH
ncbi:MAG: M28 family peptidase [Desulfobacteraceae bacterium]